MSFMRSSRIVTAICLHSIIGKKLPPSYFNLFLLSRVVIALLASMLAYKASHLEKMVVTVNPAYTSHNDYCGLDRGKRQGYPC